MRIARTSFTLQTLVEKIQNLGAIKFGASDSVEVKPRCDSQKFASWPTASFEQEKLLGTFAKTDLYLLEQFVAETVPEGVSLQEFVATHLSKEQNNKEIAMRMRRVIAAQKMLALVAETIREMRIIEINQIARRQG